jgi:predicted AlkP superfamily phosphohydrolase/phosphomutase
MSQKKCHTNKESMIIIGIDGADYQVTCDFMNQGILPNLKAIAEKGSLFPLKSTFPPLTPQAWTSAVTGVNPGKHGIFDFGVLPEDSYEPYLNNSTHRAVKAIWDYAQEEGLSMGVLNVPLTWPGEHMERGWMVTGMHTPSVKELSLNEQIVSTLLEEVPDYEIDVMSWWYGDMDEFINRCHRMVKSRLKAALVLKDKYPVDILFVVFTALDRVSHAFFGQQNFVIGEQGWKYQNEVEKIYVAIDEAVGELLSACSPSASVSVFSDHGFGTLKKDVYLNHLFIRHGFLDYSSERYLTDRLSFPGFYGGVPGRALYRAGTLFSSFLKNQDPRTKSWSHINWEETRAFAFGLFGNIFIHRKERFPKGMIEVDSSEYQLLYEKILKIMLALKDGSESVVDEIYHFSQLYEGPFAYKAPDFVVKMKDWSYITRGGSEFYSNELFSSPELHHSGNHRDTGIFLSSFLSESQLSSQGMKMEDIFPTIFNHMDLPIPSAIDGDIHGTRLSHLYDGDIFRNPDLPEDTVVSDVVVERLHSLGYF